MKRIATIVALVLIASSLAIGHAAQPAAAMGSTITVNTLIDSVSAFDGKCSLREAIVAANSNTASGGVGSECAAGSAADTDSIVFAVTGTVLLGGTQLPVIDEDVDIDGNLNITIDGDNTSRIFTIDGATVVLKGLTLEDGRADIGGAVMVEAGSDLTIGGSTVRSSLATAGHGGGIYAVNATLTITDSLIDDNVGGSGGIGMLGNSSVLTVTDSAITNNVGSSASSGGALYNVGTATITGSDINANTGNATTGAGAISTVGTLTIIESDLAGNSSSSGIGAVTGFNGAPVTIVASALTDNSGASYGAISGDIDLTLIGSTLDSNIGMAGVIGDIPTMSIVNSTISGSALALRVVFSDQLVLLFSTITDNQTGLFISATSSISMGANIVADNSTADIASSGHTGVFSSEGFNVVGDVIGTSPPLLDGPSDLSGVPDPMIGPLADNGGPVMTYALLEYSPAIDRVTGIVSDDQVVDAIGTPRPQGAAKDAGAVEAVGLAAAVCDGQLATINLNMTGVFSTGTSGADVIVGTPGIDTVTAGGGDDTICGGAGDDDIRGGPGADLVFGDAGHDTIRGGGGADQIWGGVGNDVILGQGGTDTIVGGSGDDTIDGQGAADTIDGGSGADTINGQNGADVINGGTEDDVLKGQTGPDIFDGEDDDDEMFGGDGADTFFGGDGFDKCAGNTGPDSAEAASCEQAPGVETLF